MIYRRVYIVGMIEKQFKALSLCELLKLYSQVWRGERGERD